MTSHQLIYASGCRAVYYERTSIKFAKCNESELTHIFDLPDAVPYDGIALSDLARGHAIIKAFSLMAFDNRRRAIRKLFHQHKMFYTDALIDDLAAL